MQRQSNYETNSWKIMGSSENFRQAIMHGLTSYKYLAGIGTIAASILVLFFADNPGSTVANSSPLNSKSLPTASVVELGSVQVQPVVEKYNGVIHAARTVDIAASLLARVDEVRAQVGDEVQAGQILIRLDSRELRASAAAAQADLARNQAMLDEMIAGARPQEVAQAEALVEELAAALVLNQSLFDRVSKASSSNAVAAADVDRAAQELRATEARYASSKAQLSQLLEGARPEQVRGQEAAVASCQARLAQLESRIQDCELVAPFSGRIQRRLVDEGKIVQPGQATLSLIESNSLEVHAGLPQNSVAQILAEKSLQAIVEAGGQRVKATLARVAPAIDLASGTRPAVFNISEYAGLVPGDAATVIVERPADKQGRWLPTAALIGSRNQGWAVLVAQPSSNGYLLISTAVTLLHSRGEFCCVETNLKPGSLIVSAGTHRFAEGQLVHIRTASTGISATGKSTHVD
jgi:HlyD family secretion protein